MWEISDTHTNRGMGVTVVGVHRHGNRIVCMSGRPGCKHACDSSAYPLPPSCRSPTQTPPPPLSVAQPWEKRHAASPMSELECICQHLIYRGPCRQYNRGNHATTFDWATALLFRAKCFFFLYRRQPLNWKPPPDSGARLRALTSDLGVIKRLTWRWVLSAVLRVLAIVYIKIDFCVLCFRQGFLRGSNINFYILFVFQHNL